jgi:hypothetical protein
MKSYDHEIPDEFAMLVRLRPLSLGQLTFFAIS